ncbi:hypothetical protein MRB53_013805 [Persea americana]|uniref:Uncharacterized protein n=1 Tax=Persea americana TaxID=3435 RepID=A0ACC2K8Z8_PERAE|nr:hypothetical protein MRB53_013805 [Persea americana]
MGCEINGDSAQVCDEGDGREVENDRLWMRAVRCVQWLEEEDWMILRKWRAMRRGIPSLRWVVCRRGENERERVVWAGDFYTKSRKGY